MSIQSKVEKKLKTRVQELVSALERLTKSGEIRHQQSAEFVNDLKRANSNLVAAYEKAKKKHQNKLKKLESQMMAMVERHETQPDTLAGSAQEASNCISSTSSSASPTAPSELVLFLFFETVSARKSS
uniref:Uncharacterized protein n=1 Tax=Sphaerodactylus townsendi TaxID=933632 RepID=A0ACB8EQX0_9SAUR